MNPADHLSNARKKCASLRRMFSGGSVGKVCRKLLDEIEADIEAARKGPGDEVNSSIQNCLADIFENSERPDKMSISLDKVSRSITVTYEDLDDEWFGELLLLTR